MRALTPETAFRLLSLLGLVPLLGLVYFLITGAWLVAAEALILYILLSLPLFPLARALQRQKDVTAPPPAPRRNP